MGELRPYWQSADGSLVIYHGDMRDLCATLRADAVVTDAPFGISDDPVLSSAKKRRQTGRNTLAVCQALGRRCIGIDLSEEHCETAARRLDRARVGAEPCGPLFAAVEPVRR